MDAPATNLVLRLRKLVRGSIDTGDSCCVYGYDPCMDMMCMYRQGSFYGYVVDTDMIMLV